LNKNGTIVERFHDAAAAITMLCLPLVIASTLNPNFEDVRQEATSLTT